MQAAMTVGQRAIRNIVCYQNWYNYPVKSKGMVWVVLKADGLIKTGFLAGLLERIADPNIIHEVLPQPVAASEIDLIKYPTFVFG